MNYFPLLLISLSAISFASTDPFYPQDNSQTTPPHTDLDCAPTANIAADQPIAQLKITGIIHNGQHTTLLFTTGKLSYLATINDVISQQRLRIKSIQQNTVELENWQQAQNCAEPQIQTIKF